MHLPDVLSSVLKPPKYEDSSPPPPPPPPPPPTTTIALEYQQEVPIDQERDEVRQTRDTENNAEDPLISCIKRVLNCTYHYCPTTLLFWFIWIWIICRRYYSIFSVVL